MAESITSKVDRAVDALAISSHGPRFASVNGGVEGIKKLSRMLPRILATLEDAEDMEVRDESVRLWLRELRGVACDAEDTLDEFLYLVLQVSDSSSSTPPHEVSSFLSSLEGSVDAINSRFDEITRCKQALFTETPERIRHVEEVPVRQSTSSLRQPPRIFGRDHDLQEIKGFLFAVASGGTAAASVPTLPIVGMGGLGKTTLAQHAFNDDEVSKYFDLRMWVWVSENFDLVRLTRGMIESATQNACHLSELSSLHAVLGVKLEGKRFLLVLDDVWEERSLLSNWDTLTAPLRKGSAGSKIIITTRSDEIAKLTRTTSTHYLPCLEDSDCLQLFNQQAFAGSDPNLYPKLMAIGKKISERCGGLPLVAMTLGGLLRCERDEHMWTDILQSDIWGVGEGKNGIMSVLRLSYHYLPAHLKRCFRYCSVFPKDYEFDVDRLVRMWIAQGYVRPRSGKRIEDLGKGYFDALLSRSFFQCSQNPTTFLMHDLIHDLATCVSEGECYSIEDDKPGDYSNDVLHFSISSSRHSVPSRIYELSTLRSFLFIIPPVKSRKNWRLTCLSEFCSRMRCLRLLDLSFIGIRWLPDAIGSLRHLHYLSLRGNDNLCKLPESVGRLYHLQTLDLQGCRISCLPDSISNLHNLRHIIFEDIRAYPAIVEKLNGSESVSGGLIYHGDMKHISYPKGIGKLINLQMMPGFYVSSGHSHAKLGELKDMNNIRSLCIVNIGKLGDVAEAKKASLMNKEHLWALDLRWHYALSDLDDEVLQNLRPHQSLKLLYISHFMGRSLPSWLGHRSFSKLELVILVGCGSWTSLPPLGQLPSLNYLFISSANKVESIGREFFSGGFQQLKTLRLENMCNWKSWCGAQKGQCPQLRELNISQCDDLTSLTVMNLDALQVLKVSKCHQLQFSGSSLQLGQLPSLQTLELEDVIIWETGCAGTAEGEHPCLRQLTILPFDILNDLKHLRIRNCPQFRFKDLVSSKLQLLGIHGCPSVMEWCQQYRRRLRHIPHLEIEGLLDNKQTVLRNMSSVKEATDAASSALQSLGKLQLEWDYDARLWYPTDMEPEQVLENLRPQSNTHQLVIRGYIGSRFATWLGDPSFSSLVYVTLLDCSECELLPPLGQLPNLTELHIRGASRLRCIGNEFFNGSRSTIGRRRAFPYLRTLEFYDMPMWEEWAEIEDGHLPSLCELIINNCPKLKALPRLPPSLKELEVGHCNEITFPHSFDHLASLQTMRVSQLPVLDRLRALPLGLTSLTVQGLPSLLPLVTPPTIRDLVLESCSEDMVAKSLAAMTHLTSLRISDFPELENLPLHNMTILQELHVSSCPKLKSFDCFYFSEKLHEVIDGLQSLKNLKRLLVSNCPELHFSANEKPPPDLQSMDIIDCPSLVVWHGKQRKLSATGSGEKGEAESIDSAGPPAVFDQEGEALVDHP